MEIVFSVLIICIAAAFIVSNIVGSKNDRTRMIIENGYEEHDKPDGKIIIKKAK